MTLDPDIIPTKVSGFVFQEGKRIGRKKQPRLPPARSGSAKPLSIVLTAFVFALV